MNNSFKNVEQCMKNFHPYLEKVYDNENIDFELVMNEKLKDPSLFVTLLLKRFKT